MTNFLPAGIINETLEEICEKISDLRQRLTKGDTVDVQKKLKEIEEVSLDLWVFIEKFSCQPLIYTGPGGTEEIIKRLEWALAFSEEIDPVQMLKLQQQINKKVSNK